MDTPTPDPRAPNLRRLPVAAPPALRGARTGRLLGWVTSAALVVLASCSNGSPIASGSTIDPDVFVDVMVQLRTSASLHPSGYLPAGEPERILEEAGVEREDLVEFVEVHGDDIWLMADLWEEIDRRINEARD